LRDSRFLIMISFRPHLAGWLRPLPVGLLLLGLTCFFVSCGKPKSAGDAETDGSETAAQASETKADAASSAGEGDEASRMSDASSKGSGMKKSGPGDADGGETAGTSSGETAAAEGSRTGKGKGGSTDGAAMDLSDSPYATAEVLIQDLTEKLRKGDLKGFLDVVGPQAATDLNRMRLRSLLVDRNYQVSQAKPVTVKEDGEGAKVLAVNLLPSPEDAALGDQSIELQLVRDDSTRWGVSEMRVPDILEIAAEKLGMTGGQELAGAANANDPLHVARKFLEAVVSRDFGLARRMVDSGKLSDEKLAALFIVVEEGNFQPHQEKALISTMARNNNAWIIARLESPEQQSDFGIEMSRSEEGSPWNIVGLNFSKLIQRVALQAGAGDIAYTPLRTDIQGGEQIVIYFEFDKTSVNPRAEKQLRIIADILKEDSDRKLNISGHADALGQEDYNETLSNQRARAVKSFLASYGIPEDQIVTKGFGESKPQAPNVNPDGTDNPSGRAQNRRAEVYLSF